MEQDRLPSLSIAIGRKGTIVYAGAFGLTDLENSVPASTRTVYRIGSVSKTVTATAIMQLVETGRLVLDEPVQRHCSSFPDKGVPITTRLLLAHLGGIRDYNYRRFTEEFLSNKRYASVADALAVFKDDPLAAEPGAKHIYSSFGYGLLGCAVEGASGASFGHYLEKNIFKVAGMRQTRLDVPEEIVPHRARSYSKVENGAWSHSPFVDLSDRYPAGGLLSTPSDLVAFGIALLDGRLLKRETLAAMRERQETRTGEDVSYGLGWRLSEESAELFHGGTSVGGSAYLYLRVESGTVVAVATNLDRWTEPRHDLARALADWAESKRTLSR
jgi:CubicO group peptidase (beta-lactamase class C family)